MSALVDVRPLRETPAFRRLWLGTTASGLGGQFGVFAVVYYIWSQTHSSAAVGLVGLAGGGPAILVALFGGAFADHVDRRRLALGCTYAQIVLSLLATVVVVADRPAGVPLMLLICAIQGGLGALVAPAKQAFVPALLSGDRLAAGLALNHLSFQLAMLLGPAAAGLVTATAGLGWCFAFDALTFVAALIGLAGLPPHVPSAAGPAGWPAVRAGFAFAARTPAVRGALLADLAATLLAMPVALFPVINTERYGDRPAVLGLFTTALAVGGVLASALSGLASGAGRPGVILLGGGVVWAVALGLTGLSLPVAAVLGLLALAGFADTWAVVARGTVVQTSTPAAYRGRISSLEYVAGSVGPRLGNLRAGLVAAVTSGGVALLLGGVTALAATAAIAATTPALRRFRTTGRPVG